MVFSSRLDAAHRLAVALAQYRGRNPLVLAIPRGAVEMGRVLADALEGELDVVLVRKLRSPYNPEFAVGAIDETGWSYVAEYARSAGADQAYLEKEKETQLQLLQQRRALYTPARAPIDPKGRVVIIVDDGLATGATMIAALHSARAKQPKRIVCAIPVAAPDSLDRVQPYADEIVCLQAPPAFHAVAQFYSEFRQIEDEEVVALLKKTLAQRSSLRPNHAGRPVRVRRTVP
ncbi:MAG: phosphoribosyltransferase [Burkholderiales bacterium]